MYLYKIHEGGNLHPPRSKDEIIEVTAFKLDEGRKHASSAKRQIIVCLEGDNSLPRGRLSNMYVFDT